MHTQVKNRDWVKNAAIIFLSIMLVLTFFSNTIMNRSLPEVSTQEATNGNIVAKVRGTGTVVANGSYQEKAEDTREIRAVLIKEGQEINAGDPMFVLGEGNSEELEQLQEQLRSLQVSYQRSAINTPTFDYTLEEKKIEKAKQSVKDAEIAEAKAYQALLDATDAAGLQAANERLEAAKLVFDQYSKAYNEATEQAKQALTAAEAELSEAQAGWDYLINIYTGYPAIKAKAEADRSTEEQEVYIICYEAETRLEKARADKETKLSALASIDSTAMDKAKGELEKRQAEVNAITGSAGNYNAAYEAAKTQHLTAKESLENYQYDLEKQKEQDNKSQQLSYLELSEIGYQINKVKEKINELAGGEENQILAKVSGTVQSVEITAGSTAQAGNVLCTIEVPDMGYNLSFSVTNEQARRLKPGDTATVSNFYWGSEIVATLSTIKTDPKNPMTNKLLTFELTGDVTAGGELSISVGQKSAGYEIVIPTSAIKNDTNGSFVYIIEAKNSPLGNRYKAKRAKVEVLASDDNNSAVTGDIQNGDYVITISNVPIKNGELVRMAD